jgi:hypothetical protein
LQHIMSDLIYSVSPIISGFSASQLREVDQ